MWTPMLRVSVVQLPQDGWKTWQLLSSLGRRVEARLFPIRRHRGTELETISRRICLPYCHPVRDAVVDAFVRLVEVVGHSCRSFLLPSLRDFRVAHYSQ